MKPEIHPEYQQFEATCVCGHKILTGSTIPSISVEICENCHPFYTGQQKIIDTEGRVERFKKRFEAASAPAATEAAKPELKVVSDNPAGSKAERKRRLAEEKAAEKKRKAEEHEAKEKAAAEAKAKKEAAKAAKEAAKKAESAPAPEASATEQPAPEAAAAPAEEAKAETTPEDATPSEEK